MHYLLEHEAAALLGISPKTLANWRAAGFGPPWAKPSKRVLYDPADLEEWVNASKVRPNADTREKPELGVEIQVNGHEYSRVTDLAATKRNETKAQRLEA